jgi:hypothetical protein
MIANMAAIVFICLVTVVLACQSIKGPIWPDPRYKIAYTQNLQILRLTSDLA